MNPYRYTKRIVLVFFLLFLGCLANPVKAFADGEKGFLSTLENNTKFGLNIRLRNEYWNTFEKSSSDADSSYNIFLTRVRGFADFKVNNLRLHLLVQGINALNLPENGAFGPGVLYFKASDEEENPLKFQFVEAFIQYESSEGFYFKGGRIPLREGAEVLYKDSPKLNWVINKRLSERLIGNWDWTNTGRRFDGINLGYNSPTLKVDAFGAWVTFGGFDIDDGYWKDLDNVVVTGGSITLKKGTLLKYTQIKVFDYFYFDDRGVAKDFTGDDLKINTFGANLAGAYPLGNGEMDFLLWAALQFGNFGDLDQRALALIGEVGYQFKQTTWKPWIRAGVAFASGDGDPDDSDNGTFFNMVPTNHKYYGYTDTTAFSNVIDAYLQLMLFPHQKVKFAADWHFLWLASDDEVWIGGSGPFNNSVFGYAYRAPSGDNDIEKYLGSELDLSVNIAVLRFLSFQVGYSHIFGSDGIEAVFDGEEQLDWFYAQSVINF